MTSPEMSAADLLALLALFNRAGLAVWLDGGWGVDALLEQQTRRHKDVDIILAVTDVPSLQACLARLGFGVQEGQPPHAFVLANGVGLEVDVHAVSWDAQGNGVYRMQNGEDWIYPAEGFQGQGRIEGVAVRCLSPAVQVLCHAHGYEPTDKDFRDMALLAARYGLELPPQLQRPDHAAP